MINFSKNKEFGLYKTLIYIYNLLEHKDNSYAQVDEFIPYQFDNIKIENFDFKIDIKKIALQEVIIKIADNGVDVI